MKLIGFILFAFILAGCSPSKCKPYFEFDQLEHYSIITSYAQEIKLIEMDSLSPDELRLNDVLIQPERTKLADTVSLMDLEKIGFVKKNIESSKFKLINSLFCDKKHEEILSKSCVPFYRDILIFRRNSRIVGTAKICFGCGHHVIAGTVVNTNDFGQAGDYERLQKLLYR